MTTNRAYASLLSKTGWRGFLLAFLYLVPPVVYFCLGAYWLYENGYLFFGIAGWLGFTIVFAALSRIWLKDSTKVLPPLDWEKPWTFAPRDAEAWKIVQDMADRTTDLSLDQLSNMQTYQDVTEELALKVASCYYPKAENPLDKLPIVDLLVAIELAAEDLELLCRQIPAMDQLTPGHLKGLTKAIGYAQTANELYNFTLPVLRPVTGIPRLLVQKLVAEPAWRQTKEGLQRWLFRAYINRLGMHLVELSSGRLRVGSEAYRKNVRATHQQTDKPDYISDDISSPGPAKPIAVRLVTSGLSVKQRREFFGRLRHMSESGNDQVAELLNNYHRPLVGIQYLNDIKWSESGWPDDPTDVLNEKTEENWAKAAEDWIKSDLLLVDLRNESPLRQLDESERVLRFLSEAYQKQPDWPVAPVIILIEAMDRSAIQIPKNLEDEVRLGFSFIVHDIKEDLNEFPNHDLPAECIVIAELSLLLPLARQRILAREMAQEARQYGVRRVAGQVAHAAGKAGVDLLKGWLSRQTSASTQKSAQEKENRPDSESKEN